MWKLPKHIVFDDMVWKILQYSQDMQCAWCLNENASSYALFNLSDYPNITKETAPYRFVKFFDEMAERRPNLPVDNVDPYLGE